MPNAFTQLFEAATGRLPYRYQQQFAEEPALFDLVAAPTGAGKTATAVLGWLYRRRFAPAAVRQATPRRLVYCLPMRTLVEQTFDNAVAWLGKLGLNEDVRVHKLLGGDVDKDWALHPERDAILVGTQDMLLSRALNRGYAQGRFRWPIDFGLLNNDCLWVFDELQLMGSGVSTSSQLAGLREKLATFGPGCRSVWMSATLERSWLGTVDFRERVGALAELELGEEELTAGELGKRMQAPKVLRPAAIETNAADAKNYPKALARAAAKAHQPGSLTLVVLNTVGRAKAVFEALRGQKGQASELLLVHSRFRPGERAILNERLKERPGENGRIIVATQVVEAGVDLSARVLLTELAPWPSLVQRLGRCHRYGELDGRAGDVYWLDVPEDRAAAPYQGDELRFAREQLQQLDGQNVSPLALRRYQREKGITLPFEHKHVLRRRDLLDLFDTAPDLSGNDLDVSRFVRGDDPERDVSVFWREFDVKAGPDDQPSPGRDELCPVPIGELKAFLDRDDAPAAYRKDHLDDEWVKVRGGEIRPGMVVLLSRAAGGYDWDGEKQVGLGWCGDPKAKPAPVQVAEQMAGQGEEGVGSDTLSGGPAQRKPAQTLIDHTQDVCDAVKDILAALDLPDDVAGELRHAARWHDLGKAHRVFQASLRKANPGLPQTTLWAKSGSDRPLQHERRHFRHELASALAMLQRGHPFRAAYLAAGHHGRVRLAIRALPNEWPLPSERETLFALGVHQGDELPDVDLGEGVGCVSLVLDLSPMQMGEGSWTERALALLGELGPFRLAYLEALLRSADLRASKDPKRGVSRA